jgi:hypothetical protein
MRAQITIAPTTPAARSLVHRILPPAIMACAVAFTAAWIALLGYGLGTLMELVI